MEIGADLLRRLDPYWQSIGTRSAAGYIARQKWLFRRVESIEFLGRSLVQRRISVDFEQPKGLPALDERGKPGARLVPISVYPKRSLIEFNLKGPDGHTASLYTRDTNNALDFGLLTGMVERAGEPLSRDLKLLVAKQIVSNRVPPWSVDMVDTHLSDHLHAALHGDPYLARIAGQAVDLAAQLAAVSILWVPVDAEPGTDCIVKFSYLDEHSGPRRIWKRVLIACSWRERTLEIDLPHVGLQARYHVTTRSPGGLELMSATTRAMPGAQTRAFGSSAATLGGEVEEPSEPSEIVDELAHIYFPPGATPSHRVKLQLRLAASREGFVTGCAVASILIALLVTAVFVRLRMAEGNHADTVVLIAAVPVVLGYVLVRPSEHELAQEQIVGVQVLALLGGAIPIMGAMVLVLLSGAQYEAFDRGIWAALVLSSWGVALGLALSWIFAAPRREHGRDRRWTRLAPKMAAGFAVVLACGTLIECQPYAHVSLHTLKHHLVSDRGFVLLASAMVAVAAVSMYMVIGGIWRILLTHAEGRERRTSPLIPARLRAWAERWWSAVQASTGTGHYRRSPLDERIVLVTKLAVIGPAVLWIWTTIAAMVLIGWQELMVGPTSHARAVGAFARFADLIANVSTPLSAAVIVSVTAWIAFRSDLETPRWITHTVAIVALVATALDLTRLAGLAFPAAVQLAPQVPWVAFAAWVGSVAGWLVRPVKVHVIDNPRL